MYQIQLSHMLLQANNMDTPRQSRIPNVCHRETPYTHVDVYQLMLLNNDQVCYHKRNPLCYH